MTHFTVIVACHDPADLEKIMAPWDENREVEPYRDYEKGGPEDYWLYSSLKRAAEDEKNGTGVKPYEPDHPGWSSASSKQTEDEQRVRIASEAALFASLPEPPTWESLIDMHKIMYPGETCDLQTDGDRAWTMSTYPEGSKWDYWRVGGRWGGSFPVREGHEKEVLNPEAGWDSPQMKPGYCDGGPKGALNLDRMRDEAEQRARENHRAFRELAAGLPEALPWKHFCDLAEAGTMTWDQARADYHAQPFVRRLRERDAIERFGVFPELESFAVPEDLYAERARASAVPGYALVTLEGKWMAPGEMGWFGMSSDAESDRFGYQEAANAYIESLDDDVWIVQLDCHI